MKFQKLTVLLGVATFSSISIMIALGSHQVQAKEEGASGCSNKTIEGAYGFQDTGTRKVNGAIVSYDAVRTANFDGGKHVGMGYLSIDGKEIGYTVTGTYAVKGDCTFTMDATQTYADGRPPQPYKQFGIVIRGGKEILELQTTEGKNQAGKYQKVANY